jgi:S-adenosylmethionine:tRNA ribosyltransferase-isomerase
VIVRNNTRVLPARLFGTKDTGGQVELLLSKPVALTPQGEVWECLTKPGLKEGQVVHFEGSSLSAVCSKVTVYTRQITFNLTGIALQQELEKVGHTPLPPYISWTQSDTQAARERYQTTYAQIVGSVAAPTAGLHFTPELDEKLRQNGITFHEVTLHVGLGTFLPVKTDDVTAHHMHSEWFELKEEVARSLNAAKAAGRRIIAVGTTTCRVLETAATEAGTLTAGTGDTDIFIYPPYSFKFVDGLITNFHLPESTLLMLISAFVCAPNTPHTFTDFLSSPVGQAYQTAVTEKYRFYSFGDAMLIS